MTNTIGPYIRQQRLTQKLTLRDVAVRIGYRNLGKGMNRIKRLEEFGHSPPDLLSNVIAELGIDPAVIEQLRQQEQEQIKTWLDEPVPMTLSIRYFACCSSCEQLPAHWTSGMALRYAANKVDEMGRLAAILRLSRRQWVCIEPSGHCRIHCIPSNSQPRVPNPDMQTPA